jgi:triosephosphate isomerase
MPEAWPRRPRLVAGNWKMHTTAPEAAALAREIVELTRAGLGTALAICPPFTSLETVAGVVRGTAIQLGGQNLHPEKSGPFTGEIAGGMLGALGCRWVIVGHSERRHGMGEDDATVARKLRAAQRDDLTPIVCVGETLAEREANRTADVLVRQIAAAFDGLSRDAASRTVIAYEPVWAIGTGRVATPDQARQAHEVVRATLDRVVGSGAGAAIAILYGGSVNAENAASLFAEDEIDGALVGGASLQATSFWKIAVAAQTGERSTSRR